MNHRRALPLLLMLSLLLSACGSGSSDSANDPKPSDTWNNLSWNQDNWS